MEKIKQVKTGGDALRYLDVALKHEWAVSFEYVVHAYSMPKGKFFYEDPVMKQRMDARAQAIQIGIDEMYHALQLGIIITGMGGTPTFETDEVIRYPRILDNLERDRMTEDLVTALYQEAEFEPGAFPKLENMIWNISYDEVRHSRQFGAMIEALKAGGHAEARCYQPDRANAAREDIHHLHEICRLENELTHRYLKYVMMFSEHQDLSQRLFKNSINHMRHWDKLAGILVRRGDVIRIENAVRDADGVEKSVAPMPVSYPGEDRLSALETLVPAERELINAYEAAIAMMTGEDDKAQLRTHLALTREHLFTQEWLLADARKIRGLI